MKHNFHFGTFILGTLFGAWVVWFVIKLMVWKEFTGLETASNANYSNLQAQLFDVFGLFPLIVLGPVTLFVGLLFLLIVFLNSRKNRVGAEQKK